MITGEEMTSCFEDVCKSTRIVVEVARRERRILHMYLVDVPVRVVRTTLTLRHRRIELTTA